jgi:hypothetical protein
MGRRNVANVVRKVGNLSRFAAAPSVGSGTETRAVSGLPVVQLLLGAERR